MKMVHSYWSKPAQLKDQFTLKNDGGWLHNRFHLYSWALSCLSCLDVYGNIELVTDHEGYNILIKNLKLPYTSIKVELDSLDNYHQKLWAIGKLHAYSIQDEPFIHLDGDVFVWEQFEERIENAALIAQHREVDFLHYLEAFQDLENYFHYIPEILKKDHLQYGKIDASNAGIFGGNDLDFFKRYTKSAFDFIDGNAGIMNNSKVNGSRFAIMYEQYLFSCMARNENVQITYLFPGTITNYDQISDFRNKYSKIKYTHVIDFRKKLNSYCQELENQLRLNYSEYYYNIERLFSDQVLIP